MDAIIIPVFGVQTTITVFLIVVFIVIRFIWPT